MNHITTTLLDGERIGLPVHDAMNELFNDVINNLDEHHQNLFFCGVWGRLEAMAIIGKMITMHDVENFRETYDEQLADQNAKPENTWPCDCGADLNDAEIIETNKVQCRGCKMIRIIET